MLSPQTMLTAWIQKMSLTMSHQDYCEFMSQQSKHSSLPHPKLHPLRASIQHCMIWFLLVFTIFSFDHWVNSEPISGQDQLLELQRESWNYTEMVFQFLTPQIYLVVFPSSSSLIETLAWKEYKTRGMFTYWLTVTSSDPWLWPSLIG